MGSQFFALLRQCALAARHRLVLASSYALVGPALCAPAFADQTGSHAASNAAAPSYSCRLSVLNGGHPRNSGQTSEQIEQPSAGQADPFAVGRPELGRTHWTFSSDEIADDASSESRAPARGQPIAGDFNGDGRSEIGLFVDGEWFIDLNGNGAWDRDDLWTRLGGAGDQPLVGDWDGDGKADIGVFGPDAAAVSDATESGLPDAENVGATGTGPAAADRPGRATRFVKQGARGELRADAVDHVLVFGREPALAVAGDFNGDGIDTIALYREGQWLVDVDGDGRMSAADIETNFGQPGDRPVAGDFDGDGIDEIGVYRDGVWLIQGERAGQRNEDKAIELGGPQLLPIVGDWDGDGRDEAAVYRGT